MSSRQPDQGRSTGQQGRGQSSQGQRGRRQPFQDPPNFWHPEDSLASLYPNVQQAIQRQTERQQGQKRVRRNAQAGASNTNRQNEGRPPYDELWAQQSRESPSSRVYRDENPNDRVYDPGPPHPCDYGTEEYEDQLGQHEDADAERERKDSQTLTDYNQRKPGRRSIEDFTERETQVIRERSGNQRLQNEKMRDSEREFRTSSFPNFRGGRMG